ncbi:MAG: DNA polymerase III subunit delta [Candidatus Omnitrophota bacterium]
MVKPLTPKEFLLQLRSKEPAKVYLFFGKDDFQKQNALTRLKATLLTPEAVKLNFNVFYAKDLSAQDIIAVARTVPFNSTWRIIVIYDVNNFDKRNREIIIRYLSNPAGHAVVVMTAPMRKDLDAEILKHSMAVDFTLLSGKELDQYVTEIFSSYKKHIDIRAKQMLIERLGNDLEAISQAAEKLVLYAGQKKNISQHDLELVVSPQVEETVFAITRAVSEKDMPRALNLLHRIWHGDRTAPEIIGLLLWQIRQLAVLKEHLLQHTPRQKIYEELKLSPYIIEKLVQKTGLFKQDDFKHYITLMLETDVLIKTGNLDPRIGIETLLVEMCKR